jgi:hypothetical protein
MPPLLLICLDLLNHLLLIYLDLLPPFLIYLDLLPPLLIYLDLLPPLLYFLFVAGQAGPDVVEFLRSRLFLAPNDGGLKPKAIL